MASGRRADGPSPGPSRDWVRRGDLRPKPPGRDSQRCSCRVGSPYTPKRRPPGERRDDPPSPGRRGGGCPGGPSGSPESDGTTFLPRRQVPGVDARVPAAPQAQACPESPKGRPTVAAAKTRSTVMTGPGAIGHSDGGAGGRGRAGRVDGARCRRRRGRWMRR